MTLCMSKIIRIILYAILVLPLVVTPFTIFPHHFGKAFIFQILVDLGLIVLAIKAWRDGVSMQPKQKRLALCFSVIVVVMLLTSLFGENFIRSFEGTYFRNNGLVLWLHLLGFIFLLSQIIKTEIDWRRFISVFACVGTVASIIAILQRYMTVWPGLINQSGRVFSTIGNPIFFGAFALFPFFLAMFLVIGSESKKIKIMWWFSAIINLVAIYFSESGGVFIGLAMGLTMVALAMFFHKNNLRRILRHPAFWISVVSVAIFFVSFAYQTNIKNSKIRSLFSPLDRITYISFSAGTGQTRVWAWQMALQGFKQYPILGWGVANFETVADRYYNPRFLEHTFSETVWDRPHNIYLEILAEQGILGLAAYFMLCVAAFIFIRRRENWNFKQKIIIAGLLISYLVQNFFGLDTVSSLLGFVIILSFVAGGSEFSIAQKQKFKVRAGLLVLLSSLVLWQWGVMPLLTSYHVNKAELAVQNDGEEWENQALVVLNYKGLYADQFKLALARNILLWDGTNNLPYLDLKKGYRALLTGLEEAISNRPDHFNYYYYLGQLYQIEAEYGDKSYFDKSVTMLTKAQTLSPDRQAVAFVLAKNYFLADKLDKAKEVMEAIIKQYPNNADANLYYGLILGKLGDTNKAADSFIKLVKINDYGSDTRTPLMIGQFIRDSKQYNKLVEYYQVLINHNPTEPLWLFELAKTYYLEGKLKEAEATIDQMRPMVKDSGHDLEALWNKFKAQH